MQLSERTVHAFHNELEKIAISAEYIAKRIAARQRSIRSLPTARLRDARRVQSAKQVERMAKNRSDMAERAIQKAEGLVGVQGGAFEQASARAVRGQGGNTQKAVDALSYNPSLRKQQLALLASRTQGRPYINNLNKAVAPGMLNMPSTQGLNSLARQRAARPIVVPSQATLQARPSPAGPPPRRNPVLVMPTAYKG